MIVDTVDNLLRIQFNIKEKYGLKDIEQILDKIHNAIITQLFRLDPKTAPDSTDQDLSDSFES